MSNIMAAIGIEQLKKVDVLASKRKVLAKKYDDLLNGNKKIFSFKRDYGSINPHIYVVRINGLKNKKELIKKMNVRGIQIGSHYFPNHLLNYFKTNYSLPVSEKIFNEIITLPLHPDLEVNEIDFIVKNLNEVLKNIN